MAGDKEKGVLRSMDWWTICIYVALLTFGWISVCGASYTYGETDIFSLSTRSGMQIWRNRCPELGHPFGYAGGVDWHFAVHRLGATAAR